MSVVDLSRHVPGWVSATGFFGLGVVFWLTLAQKGAWAILAIVIGIVAFSFLLRLLAYRRASRAAVQQGDAVDVSIAGRQITEAMVEALNRATK